MARFVEILKVREDISGRFPWSVGECIPIEDVKIVDTDGWNIPERYLQDNTLQALPLTDSYLRINNHTNYRESMGFKLIEFNDIYGYSYRYQRGHADVAFVYRVVEK